ncbi:hypothetical protein C0Z01_02160 [Photobacterium kishitanii]|uniref:Uncharacterized protein n=1 Tax=Photobacterium kishitanii TaxID=318456 RepID=A0A2T3KNT0_9GAMM|nr:hypothetical protein [Photobacterium kishitanii]KJG11312.1 hypothetical protein UB40_01390 [Photobacterium kishitanii]KJG56976.1 hypothetical protein UA38_12535 [Photobacterium kishitanii]KJG62629.1 hypothetical protein UA42_03765 [Photobacterium kishitanii]KJG66996.1 hypothetical protein UA40_05910 [Photobacterium kishitanii]KJG70876.1 hypothetical protein UA41_03400 [Photobacterium kishitanii]
MRSTHSRTLKMRVSQQKRQSHHRRNRAQQHLLLPETTPRHFLSSATLTLHSTSLISYSSEYVLRAKH